MSEYIFDVVSQTSKLDWAFAFQRTGAFPLDRSSLFSSYVDAEAYARGDKTDERGLGGSSYVGQPVSVYDADSNTVSLYIIEADRSLKEVGSAPLGDNASIEIVDGRVQIKDFGVSYYAYIPASTDIETGEAIPSSYKLTEGFKEGLEPRVCLDGEDYVIAWYEPSGKTIEDIAATLASVQEDVFNLETELDALEANVGQPANAEDGTAATGLYAELDKKANTADVYTKVETDEKIATEIAKVDHLKRKIVDDLDDIDLSAADATQYIYMVPTGLQADDDKYDEYIIIDGKLEKVGSWEVDLAPYATIEYVDDELAKKVDAQEGSRLMTDEEGAKLKNIEDGAEKNYINSTSAEFSVTEDGELSLTQIAQTKVAGLVDKLNEIIAALDEKVDEEEGSRLITASEISKLESIKDLIQSVDTNKFTIDENGQLLLNSVEIEEITGLADALAGKVDKVEGSRLITEQEAKKLEALNLDGEDITISGSVNASQVQELYDVVNRIVTGTGTSIFDEVERPLLGIEVGAQKNVIQSVNDTQLTVDENRKLSIKAVEMSVVTGLMDALNNKADNSAVINLESTLNAKFNAHEARILALEGQLTWQPIIDDTTT